MPVSALFRRTRPLAQVVARVVAQVVDLLAFAAARLPRVSHRAPPVPDEGDRRRNPAVLIHRTSSRPIGPDRSSDRLVFRRLGLALPSTVSASEKYLDRELQWTKAPSIEGLPNSIGGRLRAETSARNGRL